MIAEGLGSWKSLIAESLGSWTSKVAERLVAERLVAERLVAERPGIIYSMEKLNKKSWKYVMNSRKNFFTVVVSWVQLLDSYKQNQDINYCSTHYWHLLKLSVKYLCVNLILLVIVFQMVFWNLYADYYTEYLVRF